MAPDWEQRDVTLQRDATVESELTEAFSLWSETNGEIPYHSDFFFFNLGKPM
jgi:hypothetical protein